MALAERMELKVNPESWCCQGLCWPFAKDFARFPMDWMKKQSTCMYMAESMSIAIVTAMAKLMGI